MDYKKQKLLLMQKVMAWKQCVFLIVEKKLIYFCWFFWFFFVLLYSHTRRTLLCLCLVLVLFLCLCFFQVPASLFNRVMVEFANSNKTLWIFKMSKADEQQKLTKGGKKRWQKKFFKKQEKQKEKKRKSLNMAAAKHKDREIFVLTARLHPGSLCLRTL